MSDTYSRRFGGFLVFALGLFLGLFIFVFLQLVDQGSGSRPMIESWGDLKMLVILVAMDIGLLVSGFLLMRRKPERKKPGTMGD